MKSKKSDLLGSFYLRNQDPKKTEALELLGSYLLRVCYTSIVAGDIFILRL